MAKRNDKPHATAKDVKQILSAPARKLTAAERKERTSFYEETGHNAQAVEPAHFARAQH
jgi:hypothetical protein